MSVSVPVVNDSMDLASCRDKWVLDEEHQCWCLEDVLYAAKAVCPKFQRLNIFVPKHLRNADGSFTEAAKNVPVVFENNAAGYMQMPAAWLGGPRCYALPYLEHGLVYVSCGCRGRESLDDARQPVGKSPWSLVDLKTAIRFLRHNRTELPGNWDRIVSVGWSAGGAMSSLLSVTGDDPRFLPWLEAIGAFLEESDAIYAAQIYCPIVDLEHADMAYEWNYRADVNCEDSPAGPAETMTPFKEALSAELAKAYIPYFNNLQLKDPATGALLVLNEDGRSGSGYDWLMSLLERSAADYLGRLEKGLLPVEYSAADYLSGNYSFLAPAPPKPAAPGHDPWAQHAGSGVASEEITDRPPTLGDLLVRPPKGVAAPMLEPPMEERRGSDKRTWLSWDGQKASITSLDDYVMHHRGRMKPCTSFDKLPMDSAENHVFGDGSRDFVHFSPSIADALESLKEQFPEEYARYSAAFASVRGDADLDQRLFLLNPMNFVDPEAPGKKPGFYRIRVGAHDGDTAFTISMALALKLCEQPGADVDYALVWDQPHSEADYPGEILEWIDRIC